MTDQQHSGKLETHKENISLGVVLGSAYDA